ncbi:MAG: DUF6268 family outer membrane beta-barrel protein [Akkermansiaceae bacterium]
MKLFTTAISLSLLGNASLLAQKDSNILVPDSPASPSGLAKWFEKPDFDFFTSSKDSVSTFPLGQLSYTHYFSSDFDTLPGDLTGNELSLVTPLASIRVGEGFVVPAFMYRWNDFQSDAPGLIPDGSLHQFRLPVVAAWQPADRWLAGGMIMPGFSGDLDSSDNFSISAVVGAGYEWSDDFALFGGVYYFNGFDESYAIPGLNFIWKPTDRVQVYFLGPFFKINYDISDDWSIGLTGEYDSPTWNVQADEFGPDRDINYRSFRIGLRTDRRVGPYGWAFASAGYSFLRDIAVEDLDSNLLLDEEVDSGFYVETGLSLRF